MHVTPIVLDKHIGASWRTNPFEGLFMTSSRQPWRITPNYDQTQNVLVLLKRAVTYKKYIPSEWIKTDCPIFHGIWFFPIVDWPIISSTIFYSKFPKIVDLTQKIVQHLQEISLNIYISRSWVSIRHNPPIIQYTYIYIFIIHYIYIYLFYIKTYYI